MTGQPIKDGFNLIGTQDLDLLRFGILGAYHRTAPAELLLTSKHDRHPTELAGLVGCRLVTATETEGGRRWAETKIKLLTGGDGVAARFMGQDFFEFKRLRRNPRTCSRAGKSGARRTVNSPAAARRLAKSSLTSASRAAGHEPAPSFTVCGCEGKNGGKQPRLQMMAVRPIPHVRARKDLPDNLPSSATRT